MLAASGASTSRALSPSTRCQIPEGRRYLGLQGINSNITQHVARLLANVAAPEVLLGLEKGVGQLVVRSLGGTGKSTGVYTLPKCLPRRTLPARRLLMKSYGAGKMCAT